MKKFAVLGIILALSLSVLTACGSEKTDDNGQLTIQYWHTQTEEERVAVLKELIKDFEAKNPGIKVEQVPVPEEDFSSKIPAALGANRLPAIVEGGISHMLFLGSEEASDTVMHEEIINQLGRDDFFSGALKTMKKPNGKGYYGVPVSGWVQGIWYNKALFKEKGLEPPDTWESILKAARAFHDPKHKRYGIVIGTAKDDFTEQTFSQFALSNQANVFDKKGKVRFNTPEMVEALRYYKELSKYTPPGAESWREAREMYLSGRAPMVMYSTYIMGDLAGNSKLIKETGFAILEHKSKAAFGEITALSIANTISKREREAAKKFVLFLMQKENYIKYLHMSPGGSNPTRKSIANDPEYLDNEVLKKYGKTAVSIATGLETLQRFGFQDGKVYPQMGDISAQFIIGEAVYNMTEHNRDPKAVANTAQQKMKETAEE